MKSKLISILNKYIILLIVNSIIFLPWIYWFDLSIEGNFEIFNEFQTYGNYLVKVLTTIFLIFDFKREKINYLFLSCVAGFFLPILGIVIFSLLYLEKTFNQASA
ncbi:hypothetical protein [Flavobacterium mekongense]|uniref:hypothetical protein n=1 Tax=Flavobacterium mekongense TaxID=3379707 RepID=UPI003999872E